MLADKEKFIQNILKFIDLIVLFSAFPAAYYVDEIIRYITFWNVKAYANSTTVSGLLFFTSKYWLMFIGFPLIWWGLYQLSKIYAEYRTLSFKKLAWIIFITSIWASFVCSSFVFFFKFDMASRLFFLVYSGTA
ncbi:hypothetical protein KAH55_08445, partial [bacterium]|nr:hypothetical protein [bacterium]